MAIDVHKSVLTNSLPNPASQTTTTVCRDHQHKNNQPIPTITAKYRTDPPGFSDSDQDDWKTTTNTNKNKNKQATPQTTRPTTKSQLTTKSPRTRTNPPKTLAEMVTQVFSTIAKYTDDDTAEYVSAMLLENPCDDDTREMVQEIIKEAKTPKLAAYICDHLFKILDVIEKQERKKQQKQKQTSPPTTRSAPKTKPHRNRSTCRR